MNDLFPPNNDFDKRMREMRDRNVRTVKVGFGLFGLAWAINAIVGIGLFVAVICIVWHFVSKYW